VHRAASVGEHRKHVDQLLGHSVQGADDGAVGFDVVGRDRRYVVVLNLVAGAPQAPEGAECVAWRRLGELGADGFLDRVVAALARRSQALSTAARLFRAASYSSEYAPVGSVSETLWALSRCPAAWARNLAPT